MIELGPDYWHTPCKLTIWRLTRIACRFRKESAMKKSDSKSNTKPPSDAAREATAEQLKMSEESAKEVSDLCAQAAKTARQCNVPHAGVGGTGSGHA